MNNLDFRKYPALFTVMPLALGIFISYYFNLHITQLPGTYFISFLALVAIISVLTYSLLRIVFSTRFLIYFSLIFIFGIISMQFRYYKLDEDSLYKNIDRLKNKNTVLCGTLSEQPD